MIAIPLSKKRADEFIARIHRHNNPPKIDVFRFGIEFEGELAGVVSVGRPVARMLEDGKTAEVLRMCIDPRFSGVNIASFGYSKAARIAFELGYNKIITYTREDESGASMRAVGWVLERDISSLIESHVWTNRPGRTSAENIKKRRWGKRNEAR